MYLPGTKTTSSIRLLSQKLVQLGFSIEELPLAPEPYVVFTAPNGWRWLTRARILAYPFTATATAHISRNKQLSYAFAERHGVVIPKTLVYPKDQKELDAFLESYAPLIVKPLMSYGSHGVTLNITDQSALRAALDEASLYASEILVQQQFIGQEIRFTVLKGKVVSCILRETPRVVGDGSSSVAELIRKENAARAELNFDLVPYPPLDASLIPEHFLNDQTVPSAGEIVEFTKSTLVAGGGVMREVTADVHASYKQLVESLAGALNPDFLVIDMLVADHTRPRTDDNYVFLEFTTAPSLRLYYNVRSGQDYDVAAALANMIYERSLQA